MQRRYHKPRPQKESAKPMKVNQEIRVPEVRLIDESGNNVGVVKMEEALRRAHLVDLDLIEVFPNSTPPVAKIMDYGQYKYELEKQLRKNKAHQKVSELKSVRLSFRIKGQDLETRKNQAANFLAEGHKVKIEIILKGREKAHKDLAIENIKKFIASLGKNIKIIQPIACQGGQITVTIDQ
ncbi:translation initiation factor IF-3 [Candidatus Kuenenbacteria bacterium RIFCSPLOWO2_12_FULL_42_13]|uniref:Translation initiation factor IF-3 n=4 Tax=Candidatus Kueneniibacteriota TaxID=1752740 RepID=A0A1F6G2Z8_9BACT|nr:MAG: translation initiation factor IF-3 [Candidatus Kuenenbacteria bacterium RIFCSPHIGHO2_02_FULL_42_29]OGG90990.1 MAG: translation initiation factor IF-3 [Candidatus Kuenenbacteria bacterium RIFCSPLOWO2_02_FULL_42_16]OGG92501.1 MAG: translation initiation factor IF-3 [Candidatus Kuenenbacteria bacterium RIFCSPLOWO2_12_FULL_42_13]OGG99270.1 MAG: translation initiation factor IF-3 [Candidatus Kuenenbacteria bacterium RIFCSPHIGHO2_12_FULL_42_14]